MRGTLVKAALIVGVLAPVGGCATWDKVWDGKTKEASLPPSITQSAPADPFAAQRPSTASVGVPMPDMKDFPHSWDASTYILRVTQFGVMPPLDGGVAFVGDSLTDWMRWNELFPGIRSRNFGIAGDTTVGLEHRISQVIAARPGKIVLQIGTNDVEFGRSPQDIVANIDVCLAQLQHDLPGTKIIVESLLPRQPQYDAKVREVNSLLKTVVERRGLVYIDLYPLFVVDGRLDPKLTPDDIHLSGAGYLRWRDALRPYIGNN
jgi:lysophospholipase L1-like esterase